MNPAAAAAPPWRPLRRVLHRFENGVAALALLGMVLLPLAEIAARSLFDQAVPGAIVFTRHLTLWVGLLGAALAAREGKLLALATGELIPAGRWRSLAQRAAAAVSAAVCGLLGWAAWQLVSVEREIGETIAAGIPRWVAQLVLPVGLALIALRLIWAVSGWRGRAFAATGLLVGLWLASHPEVLDGRAAWPSLAVVILATLLGGPIFAALGGCAAVLLLTEGGVAATVPAEMYELSVSPILPSIPLFTLTGFLLAEGRAADRLVRVFRAWFGWMPGGTAVVCAVVCAFFTAFTGGSGVTILALGALLHQALTNDRYRERFSLGLLTASGSLGLLFAPALPLIVYGVVAEVPIRDLFVGGVLPGFLLLGLVVAWGIREGLRSDAPRVAFDRREAVAALWGAKFELALPGLVLATLFTGLATPVEASAVAALYTILLQTAVHRELSPTRGLARVLRECTVVIGGILIILATAKGLSYYFTDALIPERLVDWAEGAIESPLVFLLALNVLLLLIGCLMDIFSAIVVVVPLITPLGAAFGIDPVHLGILFIANLELGYLTPPVGLNLFLSSYRFDKPLLEIYRATFPFLLILALGVLAITYFPPLTTGLSALVGS